MKALAMKNNSSDLILRRLSLSDKDAFSKAIIDWNIADNELLFPFLLGYKSFDELIDRLTKMEQGINLPNGFVPQIQFYGFINDTIVGRLQFRTKLTPDLELHGGNIGYLVARPYRRQGYATEMMRQVLPFIWSVGLEKVLISCDKDNSPSKKIIERSGGKLIDTIWNDQLNRYTNRYWITK